MIRLLFILSVLLAPPALAETIAIVGGRVHTVADAEPIDGGTVLIRDGRIVAVGKQLAIPPDARRIDATGRIVTPGLFDAFSQIGLMDVEGIAQANDTSAPGADFSAALDMEFAVNPAAAAIPVTRIEGVTRVMVTPSTSGSLFGGFGALVGLGDSGNPVFASRAFQLVDLGEKGAAAAGGSRGASFVSFRNALEEARAYTANRGLYARGGFREALTNRLDTEALAPVVAGAVPVVVRVDRAQDIRAVLGLVRDFPQLRLILAGVAEGWRVADAIARARVPVIVWAFDNLPGRFDQLGATLSNAGRLRTHGVMVAVATGPGGDDGLQARLLPQLAGNVVAQAQVPGESGMSWVQALEAITLVPARIFGVADRLGTLEPGKLADVVIWDGDPLEVMSAPVHVLIDGAEVPLVSRQTRLRDRYRSLERGVLPLQYRR